MKQIFLIPIIIVLVTITVLAQNTSVLNQKQAVAIAEKFVAENGYTDKIPIKNKRIILERGEKISNINKIIASRFNLIEAQPVIALIKKTDRESFWSVQFLYSEPKIKKKYFMGREVKISLDGRKVSMHTEPIPIEEDIPRHGDDFPNNK